MQLNIPQASLAAGLSQVTRFTTRHGSLPVLADVLLSADENGLHLSATNLEMSLTLRLDAQVGAPGSVCVPARAFADLINTSTNAPIKLTLKQDKLEVVCDRSKAALNGVPASEFPPLPVAQLDEGLLLPAQVLQSMLQRVIFAAGTDNGRVELTGVLVIIEGDTLTLVAGDDNRLSVCSLHLSMTTGQSLSYLTPARTMTELSRLLGDADQAVLAPTQNQGQIAFVLPNCTLVSQLIDSSYPDYQQIIPHHHDLRVVLPTAGLLTACKRAETFARDHNKAVRLVIWPGMVDISGSSGEMGATTSSLEAEVTGDDPSITSEQVFALAYNAAHLREALQVIHKPYVAIEIASANRNGVIRPVGDDSFLHLILSISL